jgi:cytochrome c553
VSRPPRPSPRWPAAVLAALAAAPAGAADPTPEEHFEAHVRPVLVDVCGKCHGDKKQQAGLRLDSRAAVLAGGDGGPAVVPGKPDESRLIQAVRRTGDLKMPPDKPLKPAQVEALVRWVEQGAVWPAGREAATPAKAAPPHWAFQPVKPVAPPKALSTEYPVRNDIDRFILAKLAENGLAPSPPADRRTLIRRAGYGLTGLPPTPEEVEAFANDDSPDAYERLIDRLLASPHYGEHWGRHWLDVARYSDTKGYVYDREERFWVHARAYRDWVVRALNQDLPYDRFVMLQLAADRVAPGDPASQPAMGFLTLGRRFIGVTHDIIDDRIDAVTRGMLGLTVSCARCHDHKFDPIPTDDYYALYGVFRSSAERVVPAEPVPTSGAFAAGLKERQQKLADTMARRRREAAGRARARVGDYLEAQLELHKYPEEGFDQILGADDLIPATVRRWRDHLAGPGRTDPVWAAWHAFRGLPPGEFAAKAGEVGRGLAAAPPDRVNPLVAAAFAAPPKDMREVARRYAAVFAQADPRRPALFGVPLTDPPPPPDAATAALRRVLYGPGSPCEIPDEPIVETELFFPFDATEELWRLQGEVDRWLIRSPDAPAYATVLIDRPTPADARVFRRGNPAMPGAEVPRRFLGVLAGPGRKPFADGSGRLELARAIADPANPLTARVMVNRVWMHHFGAGLVRTPSDFGTRADPPTHPELLDWLAARFVADGWSLKKLHKLIMLSATYQQSSAGRDDPSARDPGNRLLWRMNARRLSFEEVRDSLFAVTGELDRTVGGRPFDLFAKPYNPRRTLYGLVDRQFPSDLLRAFDVANPDLHVPQRSETTVPQQALFFLNHPLALDRATALADHPAVKAAAGPEDKVRQLYRLAYQREPTAGQTRAAVALVEAAAADMTSPEPARPSAWSYGVAAFDPPSGRLSNFRPLPHFTGEAWQGGPSYPDPRYGWAKLTPTGGHPGNDLANAVVRRWTAPADLTVRIRSVLDHEVKNDTAGDGVRGSVVGSRHGVLHSAAVHNRKAALDVEAVAVRAGDTIDFVVDIRNVLNNDQHLWAPVVTEVLPGGATGRTWDARAEFGGPPPPRLGPWESLAQVLLMANEFCFAG